MTDKRFITLESGIDYGVKDTLTGDYVFDVDITKVLNAQHEEIQDQKRQLDELDGLLNKFEVTFEELEDILYMNRGRL